MRKKRGSEKPVVRQASGQGSPAAARPQTEVTEAQEPPPQ